MSHGQVPATTVTDIRYGFSVALPPGWRASAAGGRPLGLSSDIQMIDQTGAARGSLITVRVCRGGGVCPSPVWLRVVGAKGAPAVLGGAPGLRVTWEFATGGGAGTLSEVHTLAHHAGYTYDASVGVPVGGAAPAAYAALLRSWRWHPLPPAPSGLQLESIRMARGGAGWAIAKRPPGIVHTTDGGVLWTRVTPPAGAARWEPSACAPYFSGGRDAWVACPDAASPPGRLWGFTVWRTGDGGHTWSSASLASAYTKAETTGTISALSLDFSGPRHGWLVIQPSQTMNSSPGELLATTDGGASWTEIAHAEGAGRATLPAGGEVSFTSPRDGWLVGGKVGTDDSRLYGTEDGGRSWKLMHLPVPAAVRQQSIRPRARPGLPAFGGAHPQRGMLSATIYDVHGLAVQEALYRTADGGAHWAWLSAPPARPWSAADFLSGLVGFLWAPPPHNFNSVSPVQGTLYRTIDGGETWTKVGALANVAQLDFTTAQRGWAISASPETRARWVLATRDGGRTWSPVHAALAAGD